VLFAACLMAGRAVTARGGSRWWPQLAAGGLVALVLALNLVQSIRLADIYTRL